MINMNEITKVRLKFNRKICTNFFYNFVQLFKANFIGTSKMIQMKWGADSENSENSALDTIFVTHKIYEKKYFLIGLTLLLRIEQLNNLLV